jgi:hypothetical protein
MPTTINEKLIAYLTLISGLAISAVAVYYSVVGLTAIFAAAAVPIIIMGVTLELSKLVATVWLKQNWDIAPKSIKAYLIAAIVILMIITSMGIFGFLSKAHIEQGLPASDAIAKVSIIEEKIKIEQDAIDRARKDLEVLNTQIDRFSELGAVSRGVNVRNQQREERTAILRQIEQSQARISELREEMAPFNTQLREVEAKVGPIKYIAAFFYGDTDKTVLDKAVTWVILTLIVVFDPLAVILLLASQYSFQRIREREQEAASSPIFTFEDFEKPTAEELAEIDNQEEPTTVNESTSTIEKSILEQHPYLTQPFTHFKDLKPIVSPPSETLVEVKEEKISVDTTLIEALEGAVSRLQEERDQLEEKVKSYETSDFVKKIEKHGYSKEGDVVHVGKDIYSSADFDRLMSDSYVQNEEQQQSGLWKKITDHKITEDEYLKSAVKKNDNTDNAS